jgi:hypothetical protein
MTLRPAPGNARHVVALDYEIVQEQASALGRLGRALEAALAALAEFDRVAPYDRVQGQVRDQAADQMTHPTPDQAVGQPGGHPPSESRKLRARLVQEAGHALWCFMVQRESCGLRDPRPVIRDYRVPAEVQNRMGIVPGPSRVAPRRPAP